MDDRVKILEEVEDYSYKQRFRIYRARLQYRRADGQMSAPQTRLNFERGHSAAVLLHDPAEDVLLFVRQFRYPVYAALGEAQRRGDGADAAWLLETIAGVQDEGQTHADVARREAQEEAGFTIQGDLQPVADVYVSPGASSERVSIFIGQVDSKEQSGQGGGLAAEGEDTQIVRMSVAEALDRLARGEINDAKTVIALQALALRRAGRAA